MTRRSPARRMVPCFALLLLASCATSAPPASAVSLTEVSVASLSGDGSYEVETYTTFPDVPEFGDATIHYPLATTMPIGGDRRNRAGIGCPRPRAAGCTQRRLADLWRARWQLEVRATRPD